VCIPLNAALTIAGTGNNDKDVQAALQEAYENGQLRGNQLIQARKVIEKRRSLGRSIAKGAPRKVALVDQVQQVRLDFLIAVLGGIASVVFGHSVNSISVALLGACSKTAQHHGIDHALA
jgi:hypothetical protein